MFRALQIGKRISLIKYITLLKEYKEYVYHEKQKVILTVI